MGRVKSHKRKRTRLVNRTKRGLPKKDRTERIGFSMGTLKPMLREK